MTDYEHKSTKATIFIATSLLVMIQSGEAMVANAGIAVLVLMTVGCTIDAWFADVTKKDEDGLQRGRAPR